MATVIGPVFFQLQVEKLATAVIDFREFQRFKQRPLIRFLTRFTWLKKVSKSHQKVRLGKKR